MSNGEKLTGVVSARFTATEMEELKVLAEGRPISHVVRELALAAARNGTQPVRPNRLIQTSSSAGNRLVSVLCSVGFAGRQRVFTRVM